MTNEDLVEVYPFCAHFCACGCGTPVSPPLPPMWVTKVPHYNFTTIGQAIAFELLAVCVIFSVVIAAARCTIEMIDLIPHGIMP